ncbi:MAG TPA: helix-turn-helix transcriptional regulator [Planctomycetota bacterium]|nr:helix-turn-helix transcriptional regulator [Planctomycetota bacterium]
MHLSIEEVELLLHVARDATLGSSFQERFSAIGDSLSAVIPSTSLSAMVVDPSGGGGTDAGSYMFFRNGEPTNLRDYLAHYMPLDPLARFITNADGQAYVLSDHMKRAFGRDAFSSDFLGRHDPPIRFIMSCPQHALEGKLLMLSFQRERNLGDFTPREREIVRLIAPDLARAAKAIVLNDKVTRVASRASMNGSAGAIVFSTQGEVLHADSAALRLLERLERGGPPHEALLPEVRTFVATGKSSGDRVFRLSGGGWLRAKLSRGDAGPAGDSIMLFIELLEGSAARAAGLCQDASLTDREREIAELVVQGLGNREIGLRLGISHITVGVHLSGIYAKMGVAGRTELAASMLQGEAMSARLSARSARPSR